MPCNSDHMEPTYKEKELSKVLFLLDEIKYGESIPKNFGKGHYKSSYAVGDLDKLTAELCKELSLISPEKDIENMSLELQIWSRDHKIADKARLEKEFADKKTSEEKTKALDKLTDYEKNLLGLK